MIKKPTVLVLGAGASVPYGFPSGQQFLEELPTKWNGWGSDSKSILSAVAGVNQQSYEEFARHLWLASPRSIDAFLEHRDDYMKVGKTLLAMRLIGHENDSTLTDPKVQGNWMRYLFGIMDEDATAQNFHENKLSVVTFNYDRSFEYALLCHLRSLFRMNAEQCRKVFEHIRVVHLHGTLAPLAELHTDGRPYRPHVSTDDVRVAMQHIRVIHESDVDKDPNFGLAKELLCQAQQAVLLGFGFHKLNVKRLCISETCKGALQATCLGMSVGERKKAQALVGRTITLQDEDVLTCLRRLANQFS